MINLIIKMLDGTQRVLNKNIDDKISSIVEDLKMSFNNTQKISKFILSYNGKTLQDHNKTLKDCSIINNSVIAVVIITHGG